MTSSSRWWFATFVVVVFLAGTSVGVIVDRAWLLRRRPLNEGTAMGASTNGPGLSIVEGNLRRLRERLELTPEQETTARPIVQAWVESVRALQQSTREAMIAEAAEFETALSQLSPPLSAEQRARLASFRGQLIVPAPIRGRGRFSAGPDGARGGRGMNGRGGQARPGGPGRE